ncbi:hypothetical protein J7I94_19195 [Streptomyces sp. ISL-12]|uniref:hypothetical protein n=1 Tax=Streptomyces sp. ISL-12 TaxID=2819177 RepID=UPI001BE7815F|nr:hypothetical protein [Streptomyces sp. ISL-12]MBT2412661.1 hypothetical protein [Streptomyces sp. ISL-12]
MNPVARQLRIVDEILHKRDAQDALFGRQDDLPNGTDVGSFKPIADAHRMECEAAFAAGVGTFRHVFLEEVFEAMAESDPVKLRAELLQAVAVGVKWLEAIDKQQEEKA